MARDVVREHLTWGIAIGTFGSQDWFLKGVRKVEQYEGMAHEIVHCHGTTLAEARNYAAQMLGTDWIVFLDADDDLYQDYITEMEIASEPGCLLQPSTIGCVNGKKDDAPVMIPSKDLYKANYMVIGTAVEAWRFFAVGGFQDLPALEDWDLWIRLVIQGCSVKRVPFAVYVVNVNPDSRNQNSKIHNETYRKIQKAYGHQREALRSHTVL